MTIIIYSHYTDDEMKAQRNEIDFSGSYREEVVELGFEPISSDCRACALIIFTGLEGIAC